MKPSSLQPVRATTAIIAVFALIFSQLSPWFLATSAKADLEWDGALTTGTGGGTGIWINDGVTTDWYNGLVDAAWTNGQNAVFAGTPGTVTVDSVDSTGGIVLVGAITFNVPGYVIAGNTSSDTLTLANTNDDFIVNANAAISVNLAGSGGFVKDGSGTLILSGSNGNTGNTTINTGILEYGNANAVGNGAAGSILVGGSTGNGIAAFDFTGVQSVLSKVSGTSTGVIALTSNSAGENIDLSAAGLGSVFFGAVGTVNYTGALTPSGDYRLGGGGGTLIFNQVVGGTNLVVGGAGGGTVQLTSTATYVGSTTIQQGNTLQVTADNILPTASPLFINGGTLDLQSYSQTTGTFKLSGGTIAGTGTLTLNGTNSVSSVAAGAVYSLAGNNTISSGLQIVTLTTGSAMINTSNAGRGGGVGRNLILTGGTLTITGRITDAGPGNRGALGISGGGVLILANQNSDNDFHAHLTGSEVPSTMDVSLHINAGIVRLGANEQLDDNSAIVLNSQNGSSGLDLGVYSETVGNIYTSNEFGGFIQGSGTLKLSGSGSDGGPFAFSAGGVISSGLQLTTTYAAYRNFQNLGGGSNITISSNITEGSVSGTLGLGSVSGVTLTGSSSYSGGTLLNGGVVKVGQDSSFGTGTIIFNGGSLQALNSDRTFANSVLIVSAAATVSGTQSVTMTGTMALSNGGAKSLTNQVAIGETLTLTSIALSNSATAGKLTINGTGNTIVSGTISNGAATTGTLNYAGTVTGTLLLNGSNTFSNLMVTSGIVQLGASEILDDGSGLDLSGTLDMQNFSETIGRISSLGVGASFINSGLLKLSGTNSTATVVAGSITLNNNIQLTTSTAATRTFDAGANAAVLTMTGTLTEGAGAAASLAFAGTKALYTLSGSNSYSGGTTLLTGTLALDNSSGSVIGSGTLTTGSGAGVGISAIMGSNGALTLANAVRISGTTQFVGSNSITLSNTLTNLSVAQTNTVTNSLTNGTLTLTDVTLSDSGTTGKLTVNGTANTLISGVVSNGSAASSGTLAYAGTGVLALNGSNTFSTLMITSGTVRLGSSERLSDTSTVNIVGGILDIGSGFETIGHTGVLGSGGSIIGSGTLALSDATTTLTTGTGVFVISSGLQLTVGSARAISIPTLATSDFTISGAITEASGFAGGLTKTGAIGLLTLSGSNSYSGVTSVTGSLALGNDAALGTSQLVIAGASTLSAVGASHTISNSGTLASTLTVVGSQNLSLTGALTQSAAATVTNSLTSGSLTLGAINLAGNATALKLVFAGGAGSATVVNGAISNGAATTGTLSYTGSGLLVLNGSSNNTSTLVSSGTLQLGSALASGSSGVVLSASGGLAFTSGLGAFVLGGLSGTSTNVLALTDMGGSAVTGTIGSNNVTTTYSGVLGGAGGVNKVGTGNLTLSGTNTFAGGLTLTVGSVLASNDSAIGTGTATLLSGTLSSLDATARNFSNQLLINGSVGLGQTATGTGTLTFSGTDTLGSVSTLTVNDAVTFSGLVIGSGGINKSGAANLTLSSANLFSGGVTLSAGGLLLGNDAALGTGTATLTSGTLASADTTARSISNLLVINGSVSLGQTAGGTGTLTLSGTADLGTAARTLTVNDATTMSGNIIGAGGGIVKAGAANLTLSGSNTFSGGVTVTTGTVFVGSDTAVGTGTLGLAGGVIAASGADHTIANQLKITGTGAFVGTVSGTQSLAVTGTTLFSGTIGTLTNSISSGSLTLASVVLSDSTIGKGVTINGIGKTVISGAVASGTTAASGTLTYAGTGSGQLLLNGAGTFNSLILSSGSVALGANQTTTTNLVVNGSVLDVGSSIFTTGTLKAAGGAGIASIIGSGTMVLNGAGGTMATTGTVTIGSGLQLTGSLAATRTFSTAAGDYIVLNGPVTEASGLVGTITKAGIPGVLILAGNNSFSGVTTVTGSLGLGNGNALGSGPMVLSGSSYLFAYGGAQTLATSGTLTTTSLLAVTGSNDLTFTGKFAGVTTAALILSATNAMTSGSFTVGGWDLSNSATTRTVNFTGGGITVISGTVYNGGAAGANTNTTGTLSYSGSGLLVLGGLNTFDRLLISSGTVQVGQGGTAGTSGTGALVVDNGALVYNRSDAITVSGSTNGTGILAQNGTGKVSLTGSNTYSGGTFLNSGTLAFGGGTLGALSNLGTGGVTFNGGTLLYAGSNADISGRTVTLNAGGGTIDTGTSVVTYASSIGNNGAGGLTKAGTGTLILNGSNSFTGGDTVSSGTLQMGSTFALGGTTGALVVNGGVLDLRSFSPTVGSLSGSSTGLITTLSSNSVTLATVTSGQATYSGRITNGAGTLAFAMNGTGTETLSGSNSYNGATSINSGVLAAGNDSAFGTSAVTIASGTLGSSGARTLGNNITVGTGGGTIDSSGGSIVVSGSLSGSTALTTQGANTVTLSGNGSFSGTATAAAGTLAVNGNLSSASVTVNSGATLKGTGTVGAVSVNGIISGGNGSGSGKLTVSSLTLNSGAHLALQVSGTGAGTQYNQVASSGAITLGNNIASLDLTVTYNPTFISGNLAGSDRIYLALGSAPATGSFSNATSVFDSFYNQTFNEIVASNGSIWAVFYGADHTNAATLTGGNDIALYAIPEPNTWAMLLGGFGMLIGMQRFRRRRKA